MNDFALPVTRYAMSGDVNIAYQVIGDGPVDIFMIGGSVSHVEFLLVFPDPAPAMTSRGAPTVPAGPTPCSTARRCSGLRFSKYEAWTSASTNPPPPKFRFDDFF